VQRSSHIFALPNSLPQFEGPQKVFSPLLNSPENAPSIQAGAFFPDWGYQCLSTDDDSEAAHWPPFLIAAVEHITTKYGFLDASSNASRSPEEQRHLESLIAFVFAMASHQTADVTWHAIRLPTGLLNAISGIDFNENNDEAHTTLDVGGDFLAAARLGRLPEESLQWISNSWTLPVDDLVAIYERVGKSISKPVLRYCSMRGLAALKSELALGKALFETFAVKSPMLVDEVDSYYLGGMDEMTARTVNCWANLTTWFTNGIDRKTKLSGGWDVCDVFQAIKARGGAGKSRHGTEATSSHHTHSILEHPKLYQAAMMEMESISVTTDQFGAETYTVPRWDPSGEPAPLQKATTRPDLPYEQDPIYVATYVPYAHLGASVSAGYFSPEDPDEIAFAIGAPWESEDSSRPGEGNIYVVPDSYITQDNLSPYVLRPNSSHSLRTLRTIGSAPHAQTQEKDASVDQRYGSATTGLEALGLTFLVVSAPGPLTYDSGHNPSLPFEPNSEAGRLELYLPGKAVSEFTMRQPGAELGSIGSRQWGDRLLAAPLDPNNEDDFLVVSASRSDGRRACQGREKPQYGEGDVTVMRLRYGSPDEFETFARNGPASHQIVHQPSANHTNCTSGLSRGFSTCSTYNGGEENIITDVFEIDLPESERNDIPCGLQTTYARFGAATAFSPDSKLLWISAPGRGKVFGYRFLPDSPKFFENTVTIEDEDFALRSHRTGFGHAVAAGVLPNGVEWVAVSAPNEDIDEAHQVGVVRLYSLSTTAAGIKEAQLIHEIVPDVPVSYTKFGRSLSAGTEDSRLWIASEFALQERGAVWMIDVNELLGDPNARSLAQWVVRSVAWLVNAIAPGLITAPRDVSRVPADTVWEGAEPGERFGATVLAVGPDVAVGVPWKGVGTAKQEDRFFGALAVFRGKDEGPGDEL
jgi:glycosylphosphatidylinositol phospholipase D